MARIRPLSSLLITLLSPLQLLCIVCYSLVCNFVDSPVDKLGHIGSTFSSGEGEDIFPFRKLSFFRIKGNDHFGIPEIWKRLRAFY